MTAVREDRDFRAVLVGADNAAQRLTVGRGHTVYARPERD